MKTILRPVLLIIFMSFVLSILSLSRIEQNAIIAQSINAYSLNYEILSLSGDGTVLAAVSNPFQRANGPSGTIVALFDTQTLAVRQTITMPLGEGQGIAFISLNPDGSKFAYASGRYSGAFIYDVPTGSITTIVPDGNFGGIDDLEWNPVDNRIGFSEGNVVFVGNAATVANATSVDDFARVYNPQNTSQFNGFSWSPDGSRIAEGRSGGGSTSSIYALQVWNIPPSTPNGSQSTPIWRLDGAGSGEISWSPTSDQLFTHLTDTTLAIFNGSNGQVIRSFSLPPNETLYGSAWNSSGTQIAGFGQNAQYWIWDAATGQIIQTVSTPTILSDMIWLPNGNIVAAAYSEGLLVNGISVNNFLLTPTPTRTPSATNTPTRTPPPLHGNATHK